jgi:hypothetical protein
VYLPFTGVAFWVAKVMKRALKKVLNPDIYSPVWEYEICLPKGRFFFLRQAFDR